MVVLKFEIAQSPNKFLLPVLVLLRSNHLRSLRRVCLHDMDKWRHSAHPCVVVHWGSVETFPIPESSGLFMGSFMPHLLLKTFHHLCAIKFGAHGCAISLITFPVSQSRTQIWQICDAFSSMWSAGMLEANLRSALQKTFTDHLVSTNTLSIYLSAAFTICLRQYREIQTAPLGGKNIFRICLYILCFFFEWND